MKVIAYVVHSIITDISFYQYFFYSLCLQSVRNNLRQLPDLTFSGTLAGILRGWDLKIERNEELHLWQSIRALFLSVSAIESSLSNVSVTSPTSQLILQPFRRFTYVTTHSPTLPLVHLRHSSFANSSFASPTSQALHLRHLANRPWRYG